MLNGATSVTPAGGAIGGQKVVHPTVAGGTGARHAEVPGVVKSRSKLYTANPLLLAKPDWAPRVAVIKEAWASAGAAVGAAAGLDEGEFEFEADDAGADGNTTGEVGAVPDAPPLQAEKVASAIADNAIAL